MEPPSITLTRTSFCLEVANQMRYEKTDQLQFPHDVGIFCSDGKIGCCQVVLGAHSDFLHTLFRSFQLWSCSVVSGALCVTESRKSEAPVEIVLTGYTCEEVNMVLQLLNGGQVDLTRPHENVRTMKEIFHLFGLDLELLQKRSSDGSTKFEIRALEKITEQNSSAADSATGPATDFSIRDHFSTLSNADPDIASHNNVSLPGKGVREKKVSRVLIKRKLTNRRVQERPNAPSADGEQQTDNAGEQTSFDSEQRAEEQKQKVSKNQTSKKDVTDQWLDFECLYPECDFIVTVKKDDGKVNRKRFMLHLFNKHLHLLDILWPDIPVDSMVYNCSHQNCKYSSFKRKGLLMHSAFAHFEVFNRLDETIKVDKDNNLTGVLKVIKHFFATDNRVQDTDLQWTNDSGASTEMETDDALSATSPSSDEVAKCREAEFDDQELTDLRDTEKLKDSIEDDSLQAPETRTEPRSPPNSVISSVMRHSDGDEEEKDTTTTASSALAQTQDDVSPVGACSGTTNPNDREVAESQPLDPKLSSNANLEPDSGSDPNEVIRSRSDVASQVEHEDVVSSQISPDINTLINTAGEAAPYTGDTIPLADLHDEVNKSPFEVGTSAASVSGGSDVTTVVYVPDEPEGLSGSQVVIMSDSFTSNDSTDDSNRGLQTPSKEVKSGSASNHQVTPSNEVTLEDCRRPPSLAASDLALRSTLPLSTLRTPPRSTTSATSLTSRISRSLSTNKNKSKVDLPSTVIPNGSLASALVSPSARSTSGSDISRASTVRRSIGGSFVSGAQQRPNERGPARPCLYTCKRCLAKSSDRVWIMTHMLEVHLADKFEHVGQVPLGGLGSFKCEEHAENFSDRISYLLHLILHHSDSCKVTKKDFCDLIKSERNVPQGSKTKVTVKSEPRVKTEASVDRGSVESDEDSSSFQMTQTVWICTKCNENFDEENLIRSHVIVKHLVSHFEDIVPPDLFIYSCNHCYNHSTVNRLKFIEHLGMSHKVIGEDVICSYIKESQSILLDLDVNLPMCKKCVKQFEDMSAIRKHLISAHFASRFQKIPRRQDSYDCVYFGCDYKVRRRFDYILHLVNVHHEVTEEEMQRFLKTGIPLEDESDLCQDDDISVDFTDSVSQAVAEGHSEAGSRRTSTEAEDILTCAWCDRRIFVAANVADHFLTHGIGKEIVFHCLACDLVASFAQIFLHLQHCNNSDQNLKRISCLCCQVEMVACDNSRLVRKLKEHFYEKENAHTNIARQFSPSSIENSRTFRYSCQMCWSYFRSVKALASHREKLSVFCRSASNSAPIYTCHLCGFSKISSTFLNHCKASHQHHTLVADEASKNKSKYGLSSSDLLYSCVKCCMGFSFDAIKNHIKDYSCTTVECGPCGIQLEDTSDNQLVLRDHVYSDSHLIGMSEYLLLPLEKNAYRQRYSLTCLSCLVSFPNLYSLSNHSNCPKVKLRCEKCKLTFATANWDTFQAHVNANQCGNNVDQQQDVSVASPAEPEIQLLAEEPACLIVSPEAGSSSPQRKRARIERNTIVLDGEPNQSERSNVRSSSSPTPSVIELDASTPPQNPASRSHPHQRSETVENSVIMLPSENRPEFAVPRDMPTNMSKLTRPSSVLRGPQASPRLRQPVNPIRSPSPEVLDLDGPSQPAPAQQQSEPAPLYKCATCSKTFYTEKGIQEHTLKHKTKRI